MQDDLHTRVFTAIKALPRPITREQALEAATQEIGQDGPALKQFKDWFVVNGATLIELINKL